MRGQRASPNPPPLRGFAPAGSNPSLRAVPPGIPQGLCPSASPHPFNRAPKGGQQSTPRPRRRCPPPCPCSRLAAHAASTLPGPPAVSPAGAGPPSLAPSALLIKEVGIGSRLRMMLRAPRTAPERPGADGRRGLGGCGAATLRGGSLCQTCAVRLILVRSSGVHGQINLKDYLMSQQLTPELEAAVEDIWAHFIRLNSKAPPSFELIVRELMVSRPAYGARMVEAERQRLRRQLWPDPALGGRPGGGQ